MSEKSTVSEAIILFMKSFNRVAASHVEALAEYLDSTGTFAVWRNRDYMEVLADMRKAEEISGTCVRDIESLARLFTHYAAGEASRFRVHYAQMLDIFNIADEAVGLTIEKKFRCAAVSHAIQSC
jgi:hypothetical protein